MSKPLKLKICGTETLDRPQGMICTKRQAERCASSLLPRDSRRVGFKAFVVRGSRGWMINVAR